MPLGANFSPTMFRHECQNIPTQFHCPSLFNKQSSPNFFPYDHTFLSKFSRKFIPILVLPSAFVHLATFPLLPIQSSPSPVMAPIDVNDSAISSWLMFPIYLAYRDAGPSLDLIIPTGAVYIVALSGVVMNSFVVFSTIRASSLRGTANYLMALICLFEVFHQSGHTLFFVVIFSGTNFVSLLTADLFMIPMLFGCNANMMALFCAAFDRLFAVAFPLQHKKLVIGHKIDYLLAHTFVCILFGLYSLYYILDYAFLHPGIPTTGCISETLSGETGNKFFVFTTVLNIACIICYLLIWLLISCKKGVSKETNTRLLRSLVLIMLVSIGGYLINLSIYQILFNFGDQFGSPIRMWQFGFIAGVLLNVGAAANAPILYMNSVDYRKVFKKNLTDLAIGFGFQGEQQGTTSVQHISHIHRISGQGGSSQQLPRH